MHDGARVVLRVVVGGQRDRAQRRLLHTMVVHESLDLHGEHLGRRHQAVRHHVSHVAGDDVASRALPETAELPLCQRAKDHHALRHARGDRGGSVPQRSGASSSATTPLHVGKAKLATT